MKTLSLLLTCLACLVALPAAAEGPPCAPRDGIVASLATDFGEVPSGMGISDDGPMVEVFANPRTGTWTVLASDPGGQSCIVSYGQGWITFPTGQPA